MLLINSACKIGKCFSCKKDSTKPVVACQHGIIFKVEFCIRGRHKSVMFANYLKLLHHVLVERPCPLYMLMFILVQYLYAI